MKFISGWVKEWLQFYNQRKSGDGEKVFFVFLE